MGHRGLPARPPSPSHSCSLGNPISPESQPGSQTDRPHSNASWEQRAGSAVLFHCDCPNYRKTLISWGFSEQSKSLEGIVLIFSPQTGSLQGLILFISHVDSGQFLNLFCPAASSHMCCGRDKGEVFVGFLEAPLRAESDPAPKGPFGLHSLPRESLLHTQARWRRGGWAPGAQTPSLLSALPASTAVLGT